MNKPENITKIVLIVIAVFIFQPAFSQKNYIAGYVIKNNTDTLKGFVDYRDWKHSPEKIMFKTNPEDSPVTFKPTDIIEFKAGGEIYVSGIVNLEVSPLQTEKMDIGPELQIKADTVFLKCLFRGTKSLYFYSGSEVRDNFYIKNDTIFELLVYKRYLNEQSNNVINENKKYLEQLNQYLNDCNTIQSKLAVCAYDRSSLVKLFQYYYKCSSADVSFQQESEKVRTEFGLLAGVSSTSLQFSGGSYSYLVETEYKPSVNFSPALFLDIVLPRYQGKWSVNNEVLYTAYKVSGSYEDYVNENNYTITTTEIGYSYLKINNLVRFKYPVSRLFLFLNAGISNGFALSETNYKKDVSKYYSSTEKVVEGVAIPETRKYEQGLILGTGVKYDRISCEFRFEKGNGMSKYLDLSAKTKRYYLLMGFRF